MQFDGPIFFGISLLLKRNKMTNASISSSRLFLFQSYQKCQKIEIKLALEISFYTVLIVKLQKLHLFVTIYPQMY